MNYIPNIIFLVLLSVSLAIFIRNIKRINRNISLGKSIDRKDQSELRWKNMIRVAFGQSKMVSRPIAGFLHVIVYVGFVVINIELLEIIIDGLTGSHRVFASLLGPIYNILIATFEILAFLVLVAVIFFWTRRNIVKIKRFWKAEMKGWPKLDGDVILYFEVVLMVLFLMMNATDSILQGIDPKHYIEAGSFPISQFLVPLFEGVSTENLRVMERSLWWMHITGIFIFLNYLYYSKHLHILLAFPNTYFANLNPRGKFPVDFNIKGEVQMMMDPSGAIPEGNTSPPEKFGASDVFDLNWVQLMNAYSCTECGRCTSACPANLTGKKLSPRKIMMDTRDRLEEVGKNLNENKGVFKADEKQLLNDFITPEELWACTSCNACVEACPIEIDPLSIIMDMRQYLVMEKSAAPTELNSMMGNIENNGAPWPFSNQDRLQWVNE
ncbi:MAG: (Fe-S)-binding protein [Flavobacteriaceae bacterium]|jgi:heterodisulfide reductase subunit C|nr:(Fe-S)-binding protein [Flavobacteriaceae bacterium]MBT5090809.1 (Fe-S)-binding protein [Flavobacteriaceae bacterium]MBT5446221.1 (Fe-S)-binding protein [Flavobacteriaceae bacterium]MBT5974335.1 (Fe-S)-binding protein [Flavobacteriaceae bacterium]MBT7676738.1 (Fe-S)-binding protein [Flavobacteriaceae bacterium]